MAQRLSYQYLAFRLRPRTAHWVALVQIGGSLPSGLGWVAARPVAEVGTLACHYKHLPEGKMTRPVMDDQYEHAGRYTRHNDLPPS